METYRIFTIQHGNITEGVKVEQIKPAVAAITVGERGRGRCLAFVPVAMEPPEESENRRILHASVGSTRSGAPKLIPASEATSDEFAIIILRPVYRYRGGVTYSGIEDFKKLAVGGIADDEQHIVLIAPRGAIFGTMRTGRLHGDEPTYHYVFDGERILCATSKERLEHEMLQRS